MVCTTTTVIAESQDAIQTQPPPWYASFLQMVAIFIVGNMFLNCVIVAGTVYMVLSLVHMEWILLPLGLIYFINMFTSKLHITGGGKWHAFQALYSNYLVLSYFPIKLLTTAKLAPTKQYVFGFHPHGIHCLSMFMLCIPNTEFHKRFPGLRDMVGFVASILFYVPIVRECMLWSNFRDISRPVVDKTLEDGNNIFLVVGGASEALLTENGHEKIILSKRKGFVKLALKHGASLVPTYTFGLNDSFTTSQRFLSFRKNVWKMFNVCLCIFYGRWGAAIPYRQPLYFCVGDAIDLPKIENPTSEIVDKYHAMYETALVALFEKYKGEIGYEERVLQIL